MTEGSAKKIVQAHCDVFDEMGMKDFDEGMRWIVGTLQQRIDALRPIRTRESLLVRLLKEREPIDLESELEAIRMLPFTIRKVLPDAVRELKERFPRDPGGRHRALTGDEAQTACDEIAKLVRNGATVTTAKLRVSQRKGVSVRTIERTWARREELFSGHSAQKKLEGGPEGAV